MMRPRAFFWLFLFALVPHAAEGIRWPFAVSLGLALAALYVDYNPRMRPAQWWLHGLTLILPVLIFAEQKTWLGPDAATPILLMLVSLKLFEVYSYRDSIVVLVLILLVVMFHLIFRQDLFATVHMLAAVLWVFWLLYRRHQPLGAAKDKVSWLRTVFSVEVLVAVPLLLALFFLFPRLNSPLGRYMESPEAEMGFSDDLAPGDITKLVASDEIAFRVEYLDGRQPPVERLYFFGQSLSETDGMKWSRVKSLERMGRRPLVEGSSDLSYRITMEPRFENQAFYLQGTTAFHIKGAGSPSSLMSNHSYLLSEPARQSYLLFGQTRLEAARAFEWERPGLDLELPAEFLKSQPLLEEWVRKTKDNVRSPQEAIEVIRKFLRESDFRYSTTTPKYQNIEAFLFDEKVGFCEHFASGAALLLRALGVSARVVVGFQGGEVSRYGGYWIVRDRHAHAWVEVLDEKRWVLFDPTSEVNAQRIALGDDPARLAESAKTEGSVLGSAVQAAWFFFDNWNNRFNLFLLNFDGWSQLAWLQDIGFAGLSKKSLWVALGLILLSVMVLVWFLRVLRSSRQPLRSQVRKRIVEKLNRSGVQARLSQGPIETLDLVRGRADEDQWREILNSYAQVVYGSSHQDPSRELKDILLKLKELR